MFIVFNPKPHDPNTTIAEYPAYLFNPKPHDPNTLGFPAQNDCAVPRITRERERKHARHYHFAGLGHTSVSLHDRPRDRESAHEGPQYRF